MAHTGQRARARPGKAAQQSSQSTSPPLPAPQAKHCWGKMASSATPAQRPDLAATAAAIYHAGTCAEMLAAEALKIMEDHKINALVVVDRNNCPTGALNMHDLFTAKVI